MMSEGNELVIGKTKLGLIQGDITKQVTEPIVNTANSSLMGGGVVYGSIHRAVGSAIVNECRQIVSRIGRLDTGKAVITTGGDLEAKHVIHTVGPVWHGGNRDEAGLLASAYRESLKLATDYKLKSISFPSISTGAYSYPVSEAAEVALNTVIAFLRDGLTFLQEVVFVLYDSRTYHAYSAKLTELTG